MSTFPDGNFTIVNNETSRCVRVRLGRTKDVSDWQAGTKYDRKRAAGQFRQKLDDMPEALKEKLAVLPPAAFWTEAKAEAGADASLSELLTLWHGYCVSLTFPEYNVEEDPEGPEAAQAYMDAAAEEGIHPPQVESGRTPTRMHGCGANRDNTPPRWIRQASAGAWRLHSHSAVRPVPCSTRHRIPLQHADQRLRHALQAAVPDVYGDGIGFR
ncbi:hypothetical protein [Streptomyces sp. NPDC051000]|uniref:hypothetical protein n=1 Tax=Streptomyces sp. NPDC051000 TaxID=3155520 RepID=UPI0033DF0545